MTIQNSYYNLAEIFKVINHVIEALGEFKNHYDKKFNFSELSKYLSIPKAEIENIISIILNFQEKYDNVFQEYHLKKRIENDKIYLIAERKKESKFG